METSNKMEGTVREQIDLQDEMQLAGLNLVTCGNCGTVLIHRTVVMSADDENEPLINCWACKREMAHCDCPDFYYEGMPELTEELNNNDNHKNSQMIKVDGDFSNARRGDTVWTIQNGSCVITEVGSAGVIAGGVVYKKDGTYLVEDKFPSLYWGNPFTSNVVGPKKMAVRHIGVGEGGRPSIGTWQIREVLVVDNVVYTPTAFNEYKEKIPYTVNEVLKLAHLDPNFVQIVEPEPIAHTNPLQ